MPAGRTIFTEFHLHRNIWHDINNYYTHSILLYGEKWNYKINLHVEWFGGNISKTSFTFFSSITKVIYNHWEKFGKIQRKKIVCISPMEGELQLTFLRTVYFSIFYSITLLIVFLYFSPQAFQIFKSCKWNFNVLKVWEIIARLLDGFGSSDLNFC